MDIFFRNLLVIKGEFVDSDVGSMRVIEIQPDRKVNPVSNFGWTLNQVLW